MLLTGSIVDGRVVWPVDPGVVPLGQLPNPERHLDQSTKNGQETDKKQAAAQVRSRRVGDARWNKAK